MKTIACFVAAAFVLAGATVPAFAREVDTYNDGYVTHVNDHRLQICYQQTPPSVGESVQILRTSYVTIKQGPSLQRFTRRGSARITNSDSDKCVAAELIEGSAERSDHARLLAQAGVP